MTGEGRLVCAVSASCVASGGRSTSVHPRSGSSRSFDHGCRADLRHNRPATQAAEASFHRRRQAGPDAKGVESGAAAAAGSPSHHVQGPSAGGERGRVWYRPIAFPPGICDQPALLRRLHAASRRRDVVAEVRVFLRRKRRRQRRDRAPLPLASPSRTTTADVEFGPDGFLYIGMGTVAAAAIPRNRARTLQELLARSSAIDVDHPRAPRNRTRAALESLRLRRWASGSLRSRAAQSWRFSFDPATGDL